MTTRRGSNSGETGGRRGQSTVVGAVLVFGLVIAGAGLVVTLGATALSDTQTTSELARAENTMTLFDTRAAMVGLGDSPTQTVDFGQGAGNVQSEPDKGWLRITHTNFTGNGDDEILYNKSLGAVVYQNENTKVAYQGGGVWRKRDDGAALMVSPPEFRYRDATLTLPLVRVRSAGAASGGSKAVITRANDTRRVFPNYSAAQTPSTNEIGAPYNITDEPYANPIENGTVNVTVKSEYYQGWATYFRQRTEGRVTEFPGQNRVRVTLVSLGGDPGEFSMPAEGNKITVPGLASGPSGNGHPINEFTIKLYNGTGNNRDLNNAYWSMYADTNNERFEVAVHSQGKCNGGSYNDEVDVSLYYYNDTSGAEEEWRNTGIDPTNSNNGFTVNCTAGYITANLTTVNSNMEYNDIEDISGVSNAGNKYHFGSEIGDHDVTSQTTTFNSHNVDSGQYSVGNTETIGFVVNHYMQLMGPEFDLIVNNGPANSNPYDLSKSSGALFYPAVGNKFITFLHVTENNVEVKFD